MKILKTLNIRKLFYKNTFLNVKYSSLIFCLFLSYNQLQASSPNAPSNLKSCDKSNPIGTSASPYFSWFFNDPDDNEIQTAYQIIVSSSLSLIDSESADIWDSGIVNSSMQNYVYFEGIQLNSAKQYYWKVRTWDKDGSVSPYSSSATFHTGLLTNNDWSGSKWIKRNTNDNDDFTYYRKKETLENKSIQKAIVYISASHSYELYVNGSIAGKGYNHHYPQYNYYQAWDVTNLLNSNSDNLFGCLTHWYGGGQGRATNSRGMIFKAIIEYSDASTTVIESDNTWLQIQARQWITGQPQRNNEGVGSVEKIDSRQIIEDWNAVSYNDDNWEPAIEIGNHPTYPWTGNLIPDLTRVIEEEIKPVSIQNLGGDKYVIDLGKIYSGNFKINFSGGSWGSTINMTGGFVLNNDGTVSNTYNQNTNLDYYFIHNGTNSTFNPNVYLGIRYLQVENSPNALNIDNVSFITRHYEFDKTKSTFESSSTTLNNVWDLMVHSLIVGSQEGFVDTPTREKGTFLGDSWSQAVPSMSVMHDRIMNLRVLNEFIDSQDQYWADGRLNAVYPNVDGARDIPDYTQSFLVWVWDYYMQTGNIEFLEKNYSKLKEIADYVDDYVSNTTGLVHNLKGGKGDYIYGIVDWPKAMRYGYDMSVESRTVIDAYAYADFEIISKIAAVLKNNIDEVKYMTKADNIKSAINARLINSDGVYIDGLNGNGSKSNHVSQHANILPLALDIVPQENITSVVEAIKERKMKVGMVCLRWLPEALGKLDEGEHLIDLYTNSDWDGWAKTIKLGGTVTWESWNAMDNNESLSHPWGAVGLLAMQNYILGIKPLTPQHEVIEIKPLCFKDKLTYAKGVYPTDRGDVYVEWNFKDGNYILKVNIPDNITAKVYLPTCSIDNNSDDDYLFIDNVGSGEHTFSLDLLRTEFIEEDKLDNIIISPNPASDILEVTTNNLSIYKYELIDVSGRILKKDEFTSEVINVTNLKTGMYVLRLFTIEGVVNKKILIK